MCCGLFAVQASAATTASGTCGDNLTWVLDSNGTLTISGDGTMYNLNTSNVLWNNYKNNIVNVVIESGVTNISSYAFYNCNNLTNITVPNSITCIGQYAFGNCSKLTTSAIPYGVKIIESNAFQNCTSLKHIYIPCTIEKLEGYIFKGCVVSSIWMPMSLYYGDSSVEISSDWSSGLYTDKYNYFEYSDLWAEMTEDNTLRIFGSGELPGRAQVVEYQTFVYPWDLHKDAEKIVIEEGITSIGYLAFEDFTECSEIIIPNSVTKIESYAFSSCNQLAELTIPESVSTISNYAFKNCENLSVIYGKSGSVAQTVALKNGIKFVDYETGEEATVIYSGSCGTNAKWQLDIYGTLRISGTGDMTSWTYNSSSIPWYSYKKDIKKIIVDEGVTSIGGYAFYDCDQLTEVQINNGVTKIEQYAFAYCEALIKIEVPYTVTSLGKNILYNCDNIVEMTIPFAGSSKTSSQFLAYWFGGTSYLSSSYISEALRTVKISEGVTSIGNNLLRNCSKITNVVFPNSVTSIGTYVLNSCSSIKSISVPFIGSSATSSNQYLGYLFGGSSYSQNSSYVPTSLNQLDITGNLTSIPSNAFYYCKNIRTIKLPESVTTVGSKAFYYCSALKSLHLRGNVPMSVGTSAFYSVPSSMIVFYYSENAGFDSKWQGYTTKLINSDDNLYPDFDWHFSGNTIVIDDYIGNGGNVIVPSTIIGYPVVEIGYSAFYDCTDVTSVVVSDGIEKIGSDAFSMCTELLSVELPDSIISIGDWAFYCCYKLNSIELPYNLTKIEPLTFYSCESLENIVIPDNIEIVGKRAFDNCTSLKNITIGKKVTEIEEQAFEGCSSISNVYISNLKAWCNISFGSDSSSPLQYANSLYINGTLTSNIIIPSGVSELKYNAFSGCANITSITIPESVKNIHYYSMRCDNLKNISVNSGNTMYCSENGVLYSKDKTELLQFPASMDALEFVVPDSVSSIGYMAFFKSDLLNSIIIPNSVIEINGRAFDRCIELSNINIPESVTTIGTAIFYNCDGITTITIPTNIKDVPTNAFYDCDQLKSIVFESKLMTIADSAFYSCDNLTDIYYKGTDEEWEFIEVGENNEILLNAKLHCRYKITYNSNGGIPTPEQQEINYDETIALSTVTPTKEGYDFLGWSTQIDATTAEYLPHSEFSTDSSVTLYAVWQIKTYNVTYDANGGTNAPDNQSKIYGEDLTLSSVVPLKEGHIFKGWTSIKDSSTPEYQSGDLFAVNEDVILYAIWEAETYAVTYDANGGENAPSTQTKTYGVDLTLSNVKPIKAGHIFMGWATEKDSNIVKYQPNNVLSMNGDVVLYAVWQIETYSVSYDANGGINAPANQMKTYGIDLMLSNAIPAREGYTFKGWSTVKDAVVEYQPNSVYSENAELTLYAVWEINTYVITYNANGGSSAPENQKKTHNINLELSTIEPTKIGHIFKGWAISNSSSTVKYYSGDIYEENSDVTLYAVWEKEKYTITYNANGGTNAPNSQLQIYEEPLKITNEQPVKDGYTFMGWTYTSSSTVVRYQSGSTYEENRSRTLYAVWKANAYIVEYDANGGSNAPESQTKVHDVDLTLRDSIPSMEGHTFVGWSSNPKATSAEYNAADIYQSNVDITLYAVWEINTYSIIYDANGGSGAPASQKKEYGNDFIITSGVPTRDGYAFKGWSLSPESTVVSYVEGSIYSDNNGITLYAVWAKQLSAPTFKVTSVVGGKTIVVTAEQGTIYYTLDGSEPSKNSSIYSGEINLTETTVIKAVVMQENCESSSVIEKTIIVDKTGTPELGCDSNSIVEIGTTVKLNNTFDAVYYSVNGNEFVQYTNGITITDDCKIKLYAINRGSSQSEIAEYAFTIAQSEKPVINVTDVYGGKEITLSANEKDTIYYTLDGSVPDKNSNKYTGKFTVSEDTTITMVALRDTAKRSESTTEDIVVEKAISPTFSINTDSVMEDTECELYAEGYVIYYTTDGTDPMTYGKVYETPIVLTESVQIKAVAVKLGSAYSDISSKNITVTKLPSITLELIEDNGNTVKIAAEIAENPGISSALLKLKYPKSALSYIDIEKGAMLNNGICNIHETDDGLNILWINANNSYENGKLFAVNLSRNGDYEADVPISVTYSSGDIINDSFDDVNPKLNNASITLSDNTKEYGMSILENDVIYSETKVEGKVKLHIQSDENNKTADLIVAIYDEEGRLLAIRTNDVTLSSGSNNIVVDVAAVITELYGSVTVKFLLWESTDDVEPLCGSELFVLNNVFYDISITERNLSVINNRISGDVSVNVKGIKDGETADLTLALYDKNGRLIHTISNQVTINEGDNTTVISVQTPALENAENATVKVMLWDTVNDMKPLCVYEELMI